VALLAFAAVRRAAAESAVQKSIGISYPPGPQQQTHRKLLQQANETDRRTDRQTLLMHSICSTYHVQSADNKTDDKSYITSKKNYLHSIQTTYIGLNEKNSRLSMMTELLHVYLLLIQITSQYRQIFNKNVKKNTSNAENSSFPVKNGKQ